MRDFIERLRAYSPHTRKLIALSGSAVFSGLVAVMWLVGLTTGGTLAINAPEKEPHENMFASSNVASIVEAFRGGFKDLENGVTVVEEISTSTLEEPRQEDSTVIPF